MKQHAAVIETLEKLGGIATLGQLYQEVLKSEDFGWNTKTPHASIRRIVQLRPEIYKIKPGLYGLESHRQKNEDQGIVVETPANKESPEVQIFNHTYYQGLILSLGNLQQMTTFAPHQDKNRQFLQQKIADVRSLSVLPQFSYPELVKRSSTIDAIWFNERGMPTSFFEVEASTDFYNSFLKFVDLQDFHVQMVIVADESRRAEYDTRIAHSSFASIQKRVVFRPYKTLIKQYEIAVEQSQLNL